jgi:hypothetical protein
LDDPAHPVWVSGAKRVRGEITHAGGSSLCQLPDGRYLALVFGYDAADVEVFTSTGTQLPGFANGGAWISRACVRTPNGFGDYQNVQLIRACGGSLYVLGTHTSGNDDWADIWSTRFSADFAPFFQKVGKRNLKCRSASTGGERYCDFQAGAGSFLSVTGHIYVYGIEHYDDAVRDTHEAVKVREFSP